MKPHAPTRGGARALLALCASLLAGACAIPFDAALPCDEDSDCLEGQRCNSTFSRCVEGSGGFDAEDADAEDGGSGPADVGRPIDVSSDDASDVSSVPEVDAADAADAGADGEGSGDAGPVDGGPVDGGPEADGSGEGDVGDAGDASDGCSPSDEVCDGLDNDCDGAVDEDGACGACGAGAVLVQAAATDDFCIDAYEASREDAAFDRQGVALGAARSVAGVLPWSNASYEEAVAACAVAGKRLCSSAEWIAACQGPDTTLFPYGAMYDAEACNGPNVPPLGAAAPTGGFDTCVSNFGVFDQSGNVAEWTSDLTLRGGGFSESQLSLQCRSRRTPGVSELPGELFGFRCCSAPQ